ncbi:unnamed protein product [Phytophthora lilii]|uniref:Unnamed protein product n=1 Tax=Phytophthora lilii TaxID=2077276 RepID=A0A9W7CVU4_9STRA|nr:unnamed protein product [Phytophthora lilii]
MDRNELYENNNIEFNDLLFKSKKTTISSTVEIATLINQTLRVTLNNGEITYCHINAKAFEFNIEYNGIVENIKLSEILDEVRDNILYKRVILTPFGVKENNREEARNNLNLFPGFMQKHDKDFIINMDVVDVWLQHINNVLCNNNEQIYKYLLKYFTNLLLNPSKKSGALIIIKGLQGKNSTFDIFN